jgi:hypothetical protein
MHGALTTSLAPIREPKVQRGVIDHRLARCGAEELLASFERVFRDVRDGVPEARPSALLVASWLVHQRSSTGNSSGRAALAALSTAAVEFDFPLTLALLRDAPAASALAKGGRLGEMCIPISALDSAPAVHNFVSETSVRRTEPETTEARAEPSPFDTITPIAEFAPRARLSFPPLAVDATRYFFGVGTTALWHPLRNHHDPKVVARLLDQRWLRLRDAVTIAARRPTLPEMAWALATRDRWFFQPSIREALAQNPYTPTGLVLAMIPILPTATVRRLERLGSPEVRTAVELHRGRA